MLFAISAKIPRRLDDVTTCVVRQSVEVVCNCLVFVNQCSQCQLSRRGFSHDDCHAQYCLLIVRIDHMPPAALVPISSISRAWHLSAFSSSHHFPWAGFTIGTWIDQNLSMSLQIVENYVQIMFK